MEEYGPYGIESCGDLMHASAFRIWRGEEIASPVLEYSIEDARDRVQGLLFADAVRACPASVTTSARYVDGGQEEEHGLAEGSPVCTCPARGRVYHCPHGMYAPSVAERERFCPWCARMAADGRYVCPKTGVPYDDRWDYLTYSDDAAIGPEETAQAAADRGKERT